MAFMFWFRHMLKTIHALVDVALQSTSAQQPLTNPLIASHRAFLWGFQSGRAWELGCRSHWRMEWWKGHVWM